MIAAPGGDRTPQSEWRAALSTSSSDRGAPGIPQEGQRRGPRKIARVKVIEIARPGGPEVLTLAERAAPAPGPGEVLIEVAAAGVNRPDLMQRQGHYPPPKGASD